MMPTNNILNESSQERNQTFIRYIYYFSDQSAMIFNLLKQITKKKSIQENKTQMGN